MLASLPHKKHTEMNYCWLQYLVLFYTAATCGTLFARHSSREKKNQRTNCKKWMFRTHISNVKSRTANTNAIRNKLRVNLSIHSSGRQPPNVRSWQLSTATNVHCVHLDCGDLLPISSAPNKSHTPTMHAV